MKEIVTEVTNNDPSVEPIDHWNLLLVLNVAKGNFKRTQNEPPEVSEAEAKSLRRSIWKNLFILCQLFFMTYTSYNAVENLQSTINKDIGTVAVIIEWVAAAVSSLFLPNMLLNRLTHRKCIVFFIPGMVVDVMSNFYPRAYTLWITAVIMGASFCVAWTATLSYIAKIADRYSILSRKEYDIVVAQFLGIFFLFVQSTNIIGNLISSLVLTTGAELKHLEEVQQYCGTSFNPYASEQHPTENDTHSFEKEWRSSKSIGPTNATGIVEPEISCEERYMLISIFAAISFCGIVITAIFLDPVEKFETKINDEPKKSKSLLDGVLSTAKHMRNPYQIMLLPINIFAGMQLCFMQVCYTRAFVSCGLGVNKIGYVMMVFGATNAVSSLFSSYLRNNLGRIPVFTMAFILHLSLLFTLLFWNLDPDAPGVFFVISALWGVADGTWITQINVLYGTMFEDHKSEAFSTYKFVQSFSYASVAIMAVYLRETQILYCVITVLVVGFVLYVVVEHKELKAVKQSGKSQKQAEA